MSAAELPQSVWQGVNQGAQGATSPPPQHAPYPPFLSEHAVWGASLREKLVAKTRAEGHDPRVILRKFVDLAAVVGIVRAAVAFLRYLEVPRTWLMIGAATALLAALVVVRPRQEREWDPDWMFPTGSPTRDSVRLAAAAGTGIAVGGWILVKVNGGAALMRRSA